MANKAKTEINAYGIRILLSRHPEIRKLKEVNFPSVHGNRLWMSSWLLMDYFKRKGLPAGRRVMEVGCGWGLAGIYCAKKHGARVTGVDIDAEVFPYLNLHAEINNVRLNTMKRSLGGLKTEHLKDIQIVIGADICFWDRMILPLKRLVGRA